MSDPRPAPRPERSLLPFWGVVVVIAATVAAYWPTVNSLLELWNNYDNLTYTHGYLIALISAWLLWRAREHIAARVHGISFIGLAALAAGGAVWLFGYLGGIEVAHQAMLPVLLLAAVAAFGGLRAARACVLPIGYLYFAIPLWDQVNGALQHLTIFAVTNLLKLFAIPAWFDGPYVHMGTGSFVIAGGCSGLHFFIVALAISVLYGELGHDPLRIRVKLVLIAGAMAIVMNWIRVATIMIAGYLTDMQSFLVRVDHYYFGWALFGVLLVLYYWGVPRLLRLAPNPAPTPPGMAAGQAGLPRALATCALVALLAASAPLLAARGQAAALNMTSDIGEMPVAIGWDGPLAPQLRWDPRFPGADETNRASWLREGRRVESFGALYAYQAQGKEIVGYGNSLLGADSDWRTIQTDVITPAGAGTASNRVVARDDLGSTWVFLYRYQVGSQTFTGGMVSKLYYPLALLRGLPRSAVYAAAARCAGDDCEEATRDVAAFMDSMQGTTQQ